MTLSPARVRILVVALLAVSFLGALDHTVVSTSLATMAGDLGALEHMSWIMVGYTLAATVMLPVLGKLGDVVGPRSVFLVSLGLFLVASLACAAAADVGILALVAIERRAVEPILPPRILRNRTILACLGLSLIVGAGLFAVVAYVPTYIQMAYRTTATVSGLVPIATVLGMLVSNLLTGWLVSRSGRYRFYPVFGTVLGAAGLATMAALPAGAPLWVPMVVMAAVGIGTGSFTNLIFAVVQSAAARSDLGAVTATTNLVRQVGSAVGTAIVGGVVGFGVAASLPVGLDADTLTPAVVRAASPEVQDAVAVIYHDTFAPVFAGLALVYACGIVFALLLPGGRLSDEAPAPLDAVTDAERQPV